MPDPQTRIVEQTLRAHQDPITVATLTQALAALAATCQASGRDLPRVQAVTLAPEVLVNCVAPGYLEDTRATSNLDPAYRQRSRDGALLKRAADKDDVADQVVAFCRTDSITGQTLAIDAGRVFH